MASNVDSIQAFFAQYPTFDYQPSQSSADEFNRLCRALNWGGNSKAKKRAKAAYQTALVQEFNQRYGTDENHVGSWQGLCRAIDLKPPESLQECRKLLARTHVNLVDLTDAHRTNQKARVFRSVDQLSVYTKKTKRFFPREHAKAGGLLKFLLREITSPSRSRRG